MTKMRFILLFYFIVFFLNSQVYAQSTLGKTAEEVLQKGDPSKISDDGVFYSTGDILATKENAESTKIFDIPLGASVQDVFSVLEKKGIDFRGASRDPNLQTSIRNNIAQSYESKGITGDREQAALRVIDEEKFNLYSFQYSGQKYWLYPQSLDVLLNLDIAPVFDKYYPVYNSQFTIELRHLSDDMKSQGVITAYILFGKIGQEEPKSYLISLGFGENANQKLAAVLNKKYGLPKTYRVDATKDKLDDPIGTQLYQTLPKLADADSYLKSKIKNFEVKEVKDSYESIYEVGAYFLINNSLILGQIQSPFYVVNHVIGSTWHHGGYPFVPYIFEWDSKALKVLAAFNSLAFPTRSSKESLVPLILEPTVVNYIDWPMATKIAEEVEEIIKALKQSDESQKNKAQEGF